MTSIAYPPDTASPGFERENLSKPAETVRLAVGSSPLSPDRVADAIVRSIEVDRLHVTAEWQTRVLARLADLHGPLLGGALRRRLHRT